MRSRSRENLEFVPVSRRCFAEDGKEMYQNVKRTCRVLFLLINPIVLWRSRRRHRRRRCLSSLFRFGNREHTEDRVTVWKRTVSST